MRASEGLLAPASPDIVEEAATATAGRAAEGGTSRSMPQDDVDGGVLELILPDALPVELDLPDAEKVALYAMLSDLVAALRTNRHDGAEQLERLLQRIGSPDSSPAPVELTGIPADADQVVDFDRFFRVNRITGTRPAISLVQGLARTAHAVVKLFNRLDDLSEDRAKQQIDGFVAYAHLLARTFGLGNLP